MTGPDDAVPTASPGSIDATAEDGPDDLAARRIALRELAAMIGVEVFY